MAIERCKHLPWGMESNIGGVQDGGDKSDNLSLFYNAKVKTDKIQMSDSTVLTLPVLSSVCDTAAVHPSGESKKTAMIRTRMWSLLTNKNSRTKN